MGLSYAAMGRSTGPRRVREASSASRYGVYTSVADLVAMHAVARDFGSAPRPPMRGLLSTRRPGRNSIDGAGMELPHPRQHATRPRASDGERPTLLDRRPASRACSMARAAR